MTANSDLYVMMARIRAFEQRVAKHFRSGDIHGFVHVSIGQEAVASGTCSVLRHDDYITTTHRGHGHCLAKGADPTMMMAELFGRSSGLCGGKGGSMHLADPALGILGANGIVGAGIPLAAGAALAAQTREREQIAVAFFGEGALHTGAFHEASCLAVAWTLPLLLVCECNGWAEFTPTQAWRGPEPAVRAAAYGMATESIEGFDALVVQETVEEAVRSVRAGVGPAFLEVRTARGHGHYEGDAQTYRSDEERPGKENDPLVRSRGSLGISEHDAEVVLEAAEHEMDDVVQSALDAPYGEADLVLRDVYA